MDPVLAFDIALGVIQVVADIVQIVDASADGDTPVVWGQTIAGKAYLYYYDENGTQIAETGKYYFSTAVTDGYPLFRSEHVLISASKADDFGNAPRIDVYTNQNANRPIYVWSGGDYFATKMFVNGIESSPNKNIAIYSASTSRPSYYANGTGNGGNFANYFQVGSNAETMFSTKSGTTAQVYLPSLNGQNLSFDDVRQQVITYVNDNLMPEGETLPEDSLPVWEDIVTEIETETETETETGGGNGCNCDCTTIYVNADGSLTLNNDISGDMPINIDNNADLTLSVSAAAGAFGAGAIVVDPDANINLNAGAFAAGAFGAGAIVSPDVNISGEVNVSEVSISGGVSATEMNFSGDSIIVDQSGSTITNNYYYDPSEPTEPETQPFSLDYNEILSEGELESILNQETYSLSLETVSFTDGYQIDVPDLSSVPAEVVGTASSLVDYGANVISDTGLMSIYAPLSIFSIICYILRGCK